MIQVRDVFHIKFGSIDQAVTLFTRLPQAAPAYAPTRVHYHVLTDISGPMYTLVAEYTAESMGEWERMRDASFAAPEFAEWFKQFQLFVEDGQREYFTLEGECEDWSQPGVIIAREVYQAYKWQIRSAVVLLQRYGALLVDRGVGHRPRILTDASGPMFRAVIEIETEGLAKWEAQRRTMFEQAEFQVWFKQLVTVVKGGWHEFFRVEASAGSAPGVL
jgi:hypothetical protein